MTVDERLDRLTERTEAIAESLDLVVLQVREPGTTVEAMTGQFSTLNALAKQDGENIRALARIAEIHERRLTHLEGESSA
jgi:hypothetical protein